MEIPISYALWKKFKRKIFSFLSILWNIFLVEQIIILIVISSLFPLIGESFSPIDATII